MQTNLNDEFGDFKAALLYRNSTGHTFGFEGNLAPLYFQPPKFSVQKVKQAWQQVAFSELPDHSLRRYFSFHLEGIREILDAFPFLKNLTQEPINESDFIELINYQRRYFDAFFDYNLQAPVVYHRYFFSGIKDLVECVCERLWLSGADACLKELIKGYISEMTATPAHVHDSYHSLFYFENFIRELNTIDLQDKGCNERLNSRLTELNFNHLGYIAYRRQQIKIATEPLTPDLVIDFLQNIKLALVVPTQEALIYDNQWPSLQQILDSFLAGEIQATQNSMKLSAQKAGLTCEKSHLNISVAQLALLTRLGVEEELLNNPNLKFVFKFISSHFATKRQDTISAGSLSKEYYSTTQVTAAVVRDMLQKMIARINRTFFPVLAVISTTILYCLNTH